LIDAAIIAARQPEGAAPPSDAVAELLAKAEDLTRSDGREEAEPDDVVAFLEQAKARLGTTDALAPKKPARPAPGKASPPTSAPNQQSDAAKRRPTGLYVVGAVVVVAVIVIGAFLFGKSSGSSIPGIDGPVTNASPSAAAGAPSSTPVDPAQVAALMQKITANPKDVKSLLDLGNIYYSAADYKNAVTFYEKAVALTPKGEDAWNRLAAAAWNAGGKDAQALKAWNTVIALNPDNIEAHYGLGFYYLSQTPPDEAKAKSEWQKVIDIDPKSDLAKTVQSHIDSLAASPTPAPSAS
jgi:cytochrome c-type biogenesis protein CcmH/NrfG